jgi:sugar transferase (PEP-CTERM system associated)
MEGVKKTSLLLGDIIVLYLALFLMLVLSYGFDWERQWNSHLAPFSVIYLLTLAVFYIMGLYDLSVARNNIYFFIILGQALLISAALAVFFFYFIPYFGITPKTHLFINLILVALFFVSWRQLYNYFIKSPGLLNNVLFIGQNEETKELIGYIKRNPQLGYRIKKVADPKELKILHNLIDTIVQERIQLIVTSSDPRKDNDLVRNLYQCLPLKISVSDLPNFYERITGKIPVSAIEEIWFLDNLMRKKKIFFEAAKRGADITIATLGGLLTLCLTPLIACLIKIDNPGPVFYRQKRVGQDNRIFEMLKFRTMIQDAEKNGVQWAKKNDRRNTRVGNFLRKTRLDELPQLWNILKNDMSFVGPRPERPEFAFSNELLAQIPFYQIRHTIKPGLTGWAQIKYPYGASLEDILQKLQYDLYYIKNRSFILDLSIILKTIKIILSAGGQ